MPKKKIEETNVTEELLTEQPEIASDPAGDKETEIPVRKSIPSSILTLNADAEVETQESREDPVWHELQNAYRTENIGGIGKLEGGNTIAIVYYKGMRVVIPLTEMMINMIVDEVHDYGELFQRQNKILGNMLGFEITLA